MNILTEAFGMSWLGNQEPLPWSKLEVPAFKEINRGSWKLKRSLIPLARGYFRGIQPVKGNWILFQDDVLWMSLTPMELESQAPHVAAAYGHVVVMGFGMGVLVYNLLKNERVNRVTVVEIDRTIVGVIEAAADMESWEGIEKLYVEDGRDALEWKPKEKVDVLLADIWPHLGDMRIRAELQRMNENVKPTLIAGWGMELDYIDWMREQDYTPGDEDLESYQRYAKEIELPLIEQDNIIYPALALEAAKNVVLY